MSNHVLQVPEEVVYQGKQRIGWPPTDPSSNTAMASSTTATGMSPQRLVYKTVDGHEIDVDVYLPPPAPNTPKAGYCSSNATSTPSCLSDSLD
jgi:hypothetical protein